MSERNCPTIAAWLSEVPDVSQTPITPTNQRKRLDDLSGPPQTCGPLTDHAIAEISPNMIRTPSSSDSKGRNKKFKVSVLDSLCYYADATLSARLFRPRKRAPASSHTKLSRALSPTLPPPPISSKQSTKAAYALLQQSKECFSITKLPMESIQTFKPA